ANQVYKTSRLYGAIKKVRAPARGPLSYGPVRSTLGRMRRAALGIGKTATNRIRLGDDALKKECRAMFSGYYAESNTRFAEATGLPLADYGYAVAQNKP
ncbi:MAG: hypothetical protein AB7G34_14755, partial [Hyphomicrobiales bacterium]